jgi:hypothetical protein
MFPDRLLRPEAAAVVKRHGEISSKGVGYPTPSNQCWPGGVPYLYGTPHCPFLHVVERYRLLDYETAKEGYERDVKENFRTPTADDGPPADLDYRGKVLQLLFTVEDEGVFTMPWSASITYRRGLGRFLEIPCAENTHEYYAGKNTAVPQAARPDF